VPAFTVQYHVDRAPIAASRPALRCRRQRHRVAKEKVYDGFKSHLPLHRLGMIRDFIAPVLVERFAGRRGRGKGIRAVQAIARSASKNLQIDATRSSRRAALSLDHAQPFSDISLQICCRCSDGR
jgi:acetolactate synthase regulatory subunit